MIRNAELRFAAYYQDLNIFNEKIMLLMRILIKNRSGRVPNLIKTPTACPVADIPALHVHSRCPWSLVSGPGSARALRELL